MFPLNGSLEGPNRTNLLNVWRITFSKALTQVPSNTHATYTWSGPDVELPDLLVRCKKKISQTCSAVTLCCWPNTQDFHINSSIKQDMSQLFEVNYKFSFKPWSKPTSCELNRDHEKLLFWTRELLITFCITQPILSNLILFHYRIV